MEYVVSLRYGFYSVYFSIYKFYRATKQTILFSCFSLGNSRMIQCDERDH